MKKVCIDLRFIGSKGHSGIERYVRELSLGLTEIRTDLDLIFFVSKGIKVKLDRAEVREIPETYFTLKQHLGFIVNNYLRDIDLYHYPHFDAPLNLNKTQLVITIHDLHPLNIPNFIPKVKQLHFKLMTGLSIKRARKVIAVSNTTANDILKHWKYAERKLVVIYEGVSSNYYPRPIDEIDQVRTKYNLPERYIFYIGNAKPHKNLARLIQAYSRLPQDLQGEYPLVIAGIRKNEPPFTIQNIILPGYIDDQDLPALYSGATLFVFPSYAEGFGLPPLEAGACGTPSAIARATSLPEVMGENAFYFDPFNINEMRDVLLYALNNPSTTSEIAKKAQIHAKRRTWNNVAEETISVYRSVL